jgi:hypothetical protein
MIRGDEPNIVARMEPAEQAKRLARERAAIRGYELEQQKEFGAWLRRKRKAGLLNYLWPRTDKATTIQVGHWDFTIWLPNGRELRMEFKAPVRGKCSPEQEETIALMAKLGHPVLIINDAGQAQRLVEIAIKDL